MKNDQDLETALKEARAALARLETLCNDLRDTSAQKLQRIRHEIAMSLYDGYGSAALLLQHLNEILEKFQFDDCWPWAKYTEGDTIISYVINIDSLGVVVGEVAWAAPEPRTIPAEPKTPSATDLLAGSI